MEKGLSIKEAEESLKQFGPNEIVDGKKKNILQLFFGQFANFLTILLLVAALISFLVGEYVDGFLIVAIVVLNAFFGLYQEYKAGEAVAALKKITVTKVRVVRDGRELEIDSRYLVPGDLVRIEEGTKITADGKLIEGTNISLNESVLTGESLPVGKKNDEELFSGTIVTTGRGSFKVTLTGMKTKFGQIAGALSTIEDDQTPLEKKLKGLSKIIGIIGIISSIIVYVMSIVQGAGYFGSFLLAISLAVAVVPEGLPAIMTITLSIGVADMSKKKTIIRKLSAIETLGSVTLIATDKTGTLTSNIMKVKEIFTNGTESAKKAIVLNGVVCSTASLVSSPQGEFDVLGDPTEGALLYLARDEGLSVESVRREWKAVHEKLFNSEDKRMIIVAKKKDQVVGFLKGAPEAVLEVCDDITPGLKKEIELKIDEWASKGLRVLGFGERIFKGKSGYDEYDHYKFLGLVAIHDKPREEVYEAVKKAKSAGIKVVMVTGDNPKTAEAVAITSGIIKNKEEILTGDELEKYSDEELLKIIPKVSVFARINPIQKFRIVKLYQKLGEIVAVTGDGVNDAIALKQADVGIAMGKNGTDVARETADMIIMDDNFLTIVVAIEEGRNINKNLKNSIKYLLACNMAEALSLITGLFFGLTHLFTAIQFLYVNLISDGLPAIAIAFSPKEENVMTKSPEKNQELLNSQSLGYIFLIGFVGMIHVMIAYFLNRDNPALARSAAFTTLVVMQSFIFLDLWLSHRSLHRNLPKLRSNLFIISFFTPFVLQAFIVHNEFLCLIFKITPVGYLDYLTFVFFSAFIMISIKLTKIVVKL